MAWSQVATRSSSDTNSEADINQLQDNLDALKGGTPASAPTTTIEDLATDKLAIADIDDSPDNDADTCVSSQWIYNNVSQQTTIAWADWSPSYGASGSMTYNPVTTHTARYIQLGKVVFFFLRASGTTGGTASTSIYFDLPINVNSSQSISVGDCKLIDGSNLSGFTYWVNGSSVVYVEKYDRSNWGIGAGREICVTGCYEVA